MKQNWENTKKHNVYLALGPLGGCATPAGSLNPLIGGSIPSGNFVLQLQLLQTNAEEVFRYVEEYGRDRLCCFTSRTAEKCVSISDFSGEQNKSII